MARGWLERSVYSLLCEISLIWILYHNSTSTVLWLGDLFTSISTRGITTSSIVVKKTSRPRFLTVITTTSTAFLILLSIVFSLIWFWHALFSPNVNFLKLLERPLFVFFSDFFCVYFVLWQNWGSSRHLISSLNWGLSEYHVICESMTKIYNIQQKFYAFTWHHITLFEK